jgi:hypothetical protein
MGKKNKPDINHVGHIEWVKGMSDEELVGRLAKFTNAKGVEAGVSSATALCAKIRGTAGEINAITDWDRIGPSTAAYILSWDLAAHLADKAAKEVAEKIKIGQDLAAAKAAEAEAEAELAALIAEEEAEKEKETLLDLIREEFLELLGMVQERHEDYDARRGLLSEALTHVEESEKEQFEEALSLLKTEEDAWDAEALGQMVYEGQKILRLCRRQVKRGDLYAAEETRSEWKAFIKEYGDTPGLLEELSAVAATTAAALDRAFSVKARSEQQADRDRDQDRRARQDRQVRRQAYSQSLRKGGKNYFLVGILEEVRTSSSKGALALIKGGYFKGDFREGVDLLDTCRVGGDANAAYSELLNQKLAGLLNVHPAAIQAAKDLLREGAASAPLTQRMIINIQKEKLAPASEKAAKQQTVKVVKPAARHEEPRPFSLWACLDIIVRSSRLGTHLATQ